MKTWLYLSAFGIALKVFVWAIGKFSEKDDLVSPKWLVENAYSRDGRDHR